MSESIPELLEVIAVGALEMNELSDKLNEQIEAIEDALTRAQVGVSIPEQIEVRVDGETWALGYQAKKITVGKHGVTSGPLLSASRRIRVEAVLHLGQLLRCIRDRQDALLITLRTRTQESDSPR